MKKLFTLLAFCAALNSTTSAQNCARVMPGTTFVNPSGDNKTFNMIVNWQADGQKHIRISVRCLGAQIFNACLSLNQGGQSSGTTVYRDIICPNGIDAIMATFTPFTGSCGSGTQCGGLQVLPPAGAPLPIYLDKFEGTRNGAVVSLAWNTEMEINAKEFVLQSKTGSDQFNDVATIPAKNSESGSRYSYTDINFTSTTTQYRLKMVDQDGTTKFSPVVAVEGDIQQQQAMVIYPNPSRGATKVQINADHNVAVLDIVDMSGRKISSVVVGSNKSIQLPELKNGLYLLRARDQKSGATFTQKFSVIK